MSARISVFGASTPAPGDPEYVIAEALGRRLASAGFVVVTGGYGGLMEAASRGAAEAGGHVVGVTVPRLFPNRSGANRWVAEESPQDTLLGRIGEMVDQSIGAVVLPGSIGTLTELMAFWNRQFIARYSEDSPRPLVTIGEPWASLVPELARRLDTDGNLVTIVSDEAAAVAALERSLER